jgi:large subunit ribosomal protein L31
VYRVANEKGSLMQHPESHIVDVVCSNCGENHRLRSTAEAIAVEVCSNCHPAHTGAARAAVGGDRVERFNRRLARVGR